MRRHAGAAIMALALASCLGPGTPPGRYALVYGVSTYVPALPEGVSPNLMNSDDDAVDMAALLESQGYNVTRRTDTDATREHLLQDLSDLAARVGPTDLLVVYFSGHGGTFSAFGLDPADYPQYSPDSRWFFPYDGVEPVLGYARPQYAIHDKELGEILEVVQTPRKVVILDTCNSGGFPRPGADVDAVPPDYKPTTVVDRGEVYRLALQAYTEYAGGAPGGPYVLSAAGSDEESFEDRDVLQNGVFTSFLMESATYGDLDGNGSVTVAEAFAYSAGRLQSEWNTSGRPAGEYYYPHLSGGAVDFELFRMP